MGTTDMNKLKMLQRLDSCIGKQVKIINYDEKIFKGKLISLKRSFCSEQWVSVKEGPFDSPKEMTLTYELELNDRTILEISYKNIADFEP